VQVIQETLLGDSGDLIDALHAPLHVDAGRNLAQLA
jgi:hypothetical protein